VFLYKRFQSKLNHSTIRQWMQICLLMILALLLGACDTAFSAGAAETNTPKTTETRPGLQNTPTFPPQNVDGDEDTTHPKGFIYTDDIYGFEFSYPDTWKLQEKEHTDVLEQDSLRLRISYAWATEDIGPGLFGRTGVGAGDFIYAGKVNFMGQVIPVHALVYEGRTKGIFYNQGKLIEEKDLVFMIVLEQVGEDYSMVDIPETKQAEASSIVETFRRTDQAAQCLRQGGRWEVLGFSGPGCNLPTSDGGKPCSDNQECEGLCLADNEEIMLDNGQGYLVPDPDLIEEINAKGVELHGICSGWQSTFGCHVVVENGKYVEICID
jgi:hypothetical protein